MMTLHKFFKSLFPLFCLILILQFESGFCGRGEIYDADREAPQKSYEEEEEGKLVPHRTFLTTLEITLICVFTVLGVFLLIGLCVYLYFFGCNLPRCCYRQNKDYTQVQLQRERKIGEIWKTNYAPRA